MPFQNTTNKSKTWPSTRPSPIKSELKPIGSTDEKYTNFSKSDTVQVFDQLNEEPRFGPKKDQTDRPDSSQKLQKISNPKDQSQQDQPHVRINTIPTAQYSNDEISDFSEISENKTMN